jgi:serine/threonine protein kinase
MEPRVGTHPSADTLRAFGVGNLSDAEAAAVMAHLESCVACRDQVAAASGDDFLDRLRAAHAPGSTPAPAKSLSGLARSFTNTDLPPELANHPQFEVVRELGRGGMGVVYLARNRLMGRLEVLKVVNEQVLEHAGGLERFLREIQAAARLSHPNVVAAYSASQLGNLLVFAMEYVEGEDLAKFVKRLGPLPVPVACYYARQAALGLHHAFEKGMVHRDIKPQNLILFRDGRNHVVKVLDFGLAKVVSEKADEPELTGSGKMLGTPDYIAPEQTLDAARADVRADVYSLGCTLYYLLVGGPPFTGKSLFEVLQAHQSREARPLNLARPEVPEELAAVVRKMMAKEPAKRYQTPAEVAQALLPFIKAGAPADAARSLSQGPVADRPAPRTKPTDRTRLPAAKAKAADALREEPLVVVPERQGSIYPIAASMSADAKPVKPRPRAAKVVPKQWRLIAAGVLACLALVGVIGLWAGGVFKAKTQYGTIVLTNLPDDAEVLVDGKTMLLTLKDGKQYEFSVTAKEKHRLQVRKEGFKITVPDEVEIDVGGLLPVKVTWEPIAPRGGGNQAKNDPMPKAAGPATAVPAAISDFVPLFNGKDLTGWAVYERKEGKWVLKDGASDSWSVRDGAIAALGKGSRGYSVLITERDYTDFVMRFEFRTTKAPARALVTYQISGNQTSGKTPPILTLVNDTNPKATLSGGIRYPSGTDEHPKDRAPLNRLGAWNQAELSIDQSQLRFLVNGVEVQRAGAQAPTALPGGKSVKGRIGFQTVDGDMEFRNILVRDLGPTQQQAPEAGFVPLFNGKELAGSWYVESGDPRQWAVEGDAIVGRSADYKTQNYLLSLKEYGDFTLRFDFMIDPGSNGAVVIRGIEGEQVPLKGVGRSGAMMKAHPAIKLSDRAKFETRPTGLHSWLIDDRVDGPPSALPPVATGTWHRLEVTVRGDTCVAQVDGKPLLDTKLAPDPKAHGAIVPGLKRAKGKIGFQAHTGTGSGLICHFRS